VATAINIYDKIFIGFPDGAVEVSVVLLACGATSLPDVSTHRGGIETSHKNHPVKQHHHITGERWPNPRTSPRAIS